MEEPIEQLPQADWVDQDLLTRELQVGMLWINQPAPAWPELPFGGVKDSGFGRMNGAEGLRAFCTSKGVLVDRFPFGFPAKVFPATEADYATTKNAVRMLYGASLGERAKALRDLITKSR